MEFRLKGLLNLDSALTGALTAAEMKVAVATTIATSAMVVGGVDIQIKNRSAVQIEIQESRELQKTTTQVGEKVVVPVRQSDYNSRVTLPAETETFDHDMARAYREAVAANSAKSAVHVASNLNSSTPAASRRFSNSPRAGTKSIQSRSRRARSSQSSSQSRRNSSSFSASNGPSTATPAAPRPPVTAPASPAPSSTASATSTPENGPTPAIAVAPFAPPAPASSASVSPTGSSSSGKNAITPATSTTTNSAPAIVATCSSSLAQDSAYSCSSAPSVSDADANDTHTWSLDTSNTCLWASIDSSNGTISGTPKDDEVGACTLAFKANDGSADSNVISQAVSVTNVSPSLSIANATDIFENAALTIIHGDGAVQADEEGYGLYSIVAASGTDCQSHEISSSINSSSGEISYQPATSYIGTCNFAVQFDDGNGGVANAQFSITVKAANIAPTVTDSCTTTLAEDVAYSCSPVLSDADGPSATWSLDASNTCAWAAINTSTGEITGTPTDDDVGTCDLVYKVDDSIATSPNYTVSVTVTNVAPTMTIADTHPIQMNAPAQVVHADANIQASDEGYGTYSFDHATTSSPKCDDNKVSLSIDGATGAVTFQPLAGYVANCNIKVVFNDGNSPAISDEFRVLMFNTDHRNNFRSVGTGNNSALASGAGNAANFALGSVIFSSPLPDNVGIGDVIQYETTTGVQGSVTQLAIIARRISATVFILKKPDGTLPTSNITGDEDWSIFRAYDSFANAEQGTENTGIDATLRDFDTWSGGRDLVANSEIWHIVHYADAPSAAMTISGWVTDATHRLKIYTPYDTSQVGVSQRHSGAWDANKAHIIQSGSGQGLINSSANYLDLEGLQIRLSGITANNRHAITNDIPAGATYEMNIRNNILWGDASNSNSNHNGINIDSSNSSAGATRISNNIIYDFQGTGDSAGFFADPDGNHLIYLHNNTAINNSYGYHSTGAHTIIMANNIAQSSVNADYSGISNANSKNNISSDVTGPGGTDNQTSVSLTFKDAASDDFSLNHADVQAFRKGADLSTDGNLPVTDDILGTSRGSVFDIGAFQFTGGTSCVANQVTLIDNLGGETSHASIQDAIDLAGTGYKVVVGSGTFEEVVTINGLTNFDLITHCDAIIRRLIPKNSNSILVYGFDIDVNNVNVIGVDFGTPFSDGVTLDTIKVHNAGLSGSIRHGISVGSNDANVIIRNSQIYNNTEIGVVFNGNNTNSMQLINSHIHSNNWSGVKVSTGSKAVVLMNNLIENNGLAGSASNKYGIFRSAGGGAAAGDLTLIGNTVINNNGNTNATSSIDLGNFDIQLDVGDSGNLTTGGAEGTGVSSY